MRINPMEIAIVVVVFTIVVLIPLGFVGMFLFARKKRDDETK